MRFSLIVRRLVEIGVPRYKHTFEPLAKRSVTAPLPHDLFLCRREIESHRLVLAARSERFGLDVIIFYLVLRYAHKQTDVPLLRRYWVPLCLALFACAAVFYGTFVQQGLDVRSTIQSAYICQLPISFLYIPLMLRQHSLVGWSLWTAWTRTLGTGLNRCLRLHAISRSAVSVGNGGYLDGGGFPVHVPVYDSTPRPGGSLTGSGAYPRRHRLFYRLRTS